MQAGTSRSIPADENGGGTVAHASPGAQRAWQVQFTAVGDRRRMAELDRMNGDSYLWHLNRLSWPA